MNNTEVLKDITEMLDKIYGKLSALEELIKGSRGQSEAEESIIANSFLKAISEAIDSGKYCLLPKEKNAPGQTERYIKGANGREIIGIYDDYFITLKSLPAYKIYREFEGRKTDMRALYIMLENIGLIRTRKGYKQKVVGDKKCSAIDVIISKAGPLRKYLNQKGE